MVYLMQNTEPEFASLYSVDAMMQLMVSGDKSDFDILLDRFLSANGLDNTPENRTVLNEVYNMTYSIKVLIRY